MRHSRAEGFAHTPIECLYKSMYEFEYGEFVLIISLEREEKERERRRERQGEREKE